MKLYYFVDSIPDRRYSSSSNALSLMDEIVSRYGRRVKKYDRTTYKDESFDIRIYSLSITPEMIEASFNSDKTKTLSIKSPLFIKRFLHSALNFPLVASLEPGSIMHYFNRPVYKTKKNTRVLLEISSVKEIVAPEFFDNASTLFESIKSINSCDAIITHSSHMAEELLSKLFIDPSKLRIIPRGIREKTEQYDLSSYDLPENFVLFVGKIKRYKNLERLIQCFEGDRIDKDFCLVISGDCYGEHANYLRTISKRLPKGRIRFTGYVPEKVLPSIMKKATALIEPCHVNDFPENIVQAQALGVPVAASDIDSHSSVCKDTVRYFSSLSRGEMTEAINSVCNDSKLREDNIAKGKTLAEKMSWDHVAPMYRKVYEELS